MYIYIYNVYIYIYEYVCVYYVPLNPCLFLETLPKFSHPVCWESRALHHKNGGRELGLKTVGIAMPFAPSPMKFTIFMGGMVKTIQKWQGGKHGIAT